MEFSFYVLLMVCRVLVCSLSAVLSTCVLRASELYMVIDIMLTSNFVQLLVPWSCLTFNPLMANQSVLCSHTETLAFVRVERQIFSSRSGKSSSYTSLCFSVYEMVCIFSFWCDMFMS